MPADGKELERVTLSRQLAVIAAAVLAAAAVGGCNSTPEPLHPAHQRLQAPPKTISVFQLAGRLNLKVVANRRTFAHLAGPGNSVTIFPQPGAAVFVNGIRLPCRGPILASDSTIFVPVSAEWLIRPVLRPEPPPPEVRPDEPQQPRPVVVIDPGHGGRDPGAIACNGLFEKDVVLPVALMVRRRLQGGAHVIMTRQTDCFVELERRAEIANEARAGLFVSIHADSAGNAGARGHTLYVARGASSRSLAAAERVDRSLHGATRHSRGVRRANYRVLVRTTCPAILVEIGYLSNRFEARRLAGADHQRAVAHAIAAGILEFLGD